MKIIAMVLALASGCTGGDGASHETTTPRKQTPRDLESGWWCTSATRPGGMGWCSRSFATCDSFRVKGQQIGSGNTDCRVSIKAACFVGQKRLFDQESLVCQPSFRDCNEMRREMTEGLGRDDWTDVTECTDVR